jgi:hypothetical protein
MSQAKAHSPSGWMRRTGRRWNVLPPGWRVTGCGPAPAHRRADQSLEREGCFVANSRQFRVKLIPKDGEA